MGARPCRLPQKVPGKLTCRPRRGSITPIHTQAPSRSPTVVRRAARIASTISGARGFARSRAPTCRRSRQLFSALGHLLALRSRSGIPQALADLEAHRVGGRNLQDLTGLQVAAAAGAALINLEAAEIGKPPDAVLKSLSFPA